jgi:Flp pilus assembly protein TadB
MNQMADGAQAPPPPERPTAELVRQLSEQVSVLVRDELKLAQLEMTRKGKQAGTGAGMLGGGGLIALYGVGCLIACAILAISGVLAAWLSALIVGVALLAVAGAAALVGKSRLQKAAPPVPAETVDSVKTDVDEIKQRARR